MSIPQLHDADVRGFASDNYSGVHPEVLAALAVANSGHQPAYGADAYTARLAETMRELFGAPTQTYPVFNGTGANVTGLQALTSRWGAVVCADSAHIHVDEGGAPEKMAGLKLLTVATPDGKLTPELLLVQARDFDDEHRSQAQVVSITQSTELGTLYTVDEVRAIAERVHALGMTLHMDGARIANAAAALDVPLRAFTTDAGVDVLSFGGTKNGAMGAEAVLVLNPSAARELVRLRKTSMQLGSKMRFASVQLLALLTDDLYLRNARHANAMAARLDAAVRAVPGVSVQRPVQVNSVFAVLPTQVTEKLQQRFRFYTWDPATGEVRWMCSFDTTADDVASFAAAITEEMAAYSS
ncbi:MAG: beta-eliminating lyase-related protein [Mycobacteriaceae bacterium]